MKPALKRGKTITKDIKNRSITYNTYIQTTIVFGIIFCFLFLLLIKKYKIVLPKQINKKSKQKILNFLKIQKYQK